PSQVWRERKISFTVAPITLHLKSRARVSTRVRARARCARPSGWDNDRAVKITYPPDLPVSERRDEIAAAIRDHQVVIVAGETGSGKTTQLPKICLELGRGA